MVDYHVITRGLASSQVQKETVVNEHAAKPNLLLHQFTAGKLTEPGTCWAAAQHGALQLNSQALQISSPSVQFS